jgi:hypothetical protein
MFELLILTEVYTSVSDFHFPQMKFGKYWFHLQFFLMQIFTF